MKIDLNVIVRGEDTPGSDRIGVLYRSENHTSDKANPPRFVALSGAYTNEATATLQDVIRIIDTCRDDLEMAVIINNPADPRIRNRAAVLCDILNVRRDYDRLPDYRQIRSDLGDIALRIWQRIRHANMPHRTTTARIMYLDSAGFTNGLANLYDESGEWCHALTAAELAAGLETADPLMERFTVHETEMNTDYSINTELARQVLYAISPVPERTEPARLAA